MGRKFMLACTALIAASLSLAGCAHCKNGWCGLCGDTEQPHSASASGSSKSIPVAANAAKPASGGTAPSAWGSQPTRLPTGPAASTTSLTPVQSSGWNSSPAAAKPLNGLPEAAGRVPYSASSSVTPSNPSSTTGYTPTASNPSATTGYTPTSNPIAVSPSIERPVQPTGFAQPMEKTAVRTTVAPATVVPATYTSPVVPTSAAAPVYVVPASTSMNTMSEVQPSVMPKVDSTPAPSYDSGRGASRPSAASESRYNNVPGSGEVITIYSPEPHVPASAGPSLGSADPALVKPGKSE